VKIKLDWKIILFSLVILLAIFLRLWHFHDWLFFKMDQARDASTIQRAFEQGPGWLPFLGPKAGGTSANVGPAFYYFQYFSAVLFQSVRPEVLAFPDLLFSILSIPLFYFFLKKYFSRDWSLILASLYAVCFLGIEYSRFAWNPNSLVFFNLLFFYALLNIFDEKTKYKLRWIILAGISFAVSTQLHFLSFATLPIITTLFILFTWREAKKHLILKNTAIFLGIVLFLYLPVFFNEIVTHGKNIQAFVAAVKSKPSSHSFSENILKNIFYFGYYWLLILTGWISKKDNLVLSIIVWLGLILPALLLGKHFFQQEKNSLKKKFILLSGLWLAVYFLAYIPFAYQIRPRFFLPLLALPFVFMGYIVKYLWEKERKIFKAAVAILLAVVFWGNLYGTYLWFEEIKLSQKEAVYPQRTIILKARDGIVLWHLEKAVEYMKEKCPSKEVYYKTSAEYKRPVKYLLNLSGKKAGPIEAIKIGSPNQCVFILGLSRKKEMPFVQETTSDFFVEESRKIGALTVYKLSPQKDLWGKPLSTYEKGSSDEEKLKRAFWRDLWK